jgi:hypothetical protein
MARQRKEKEAKIKLKQPDRSGPDPSTETLLSIAANRGLLKIPQGKDESEGHEDEPLTGRLADSILWSITLTMLHFTLDVLVTHQYAVELSWPVIFKRTAQAFPSMPLLECIHNSLTKYSYPPTRLLLPPPLRALRSPPTPPPSNTAFAAPAPLLRQQRGCRMLLNPRLKHVRVLRSYETGSSIGLSLDLVSRRARPRLGGCQFALLPWFPEDRRVRIPLNGPLCIQGNKVQRFGDYTSVNRNYHEIPLSAPLYLS